MRIKLDKSSEYETKLGLMKLKLESKDKEIDQLEKTTLRTSEVFEENSRLKAEIIDLNTRCVSLERRLIDKSTLETSVVQEWSDKFQSMKDHIREVEKDKVREVKLHSKRVKKMLTKLHSKRVKMMLTKLHSERVKMMLTKLVAQIEAIGHRFDELQSEWRLKESDYLNLLSKAEEKLTVVFDRAERLQAVLTSKTKELTKLGTREAEMSEENTVLRSEVSELKTTLETSEELLGRIKNRVSLLQEENTGLKVELERRSSRLIRVKYDCKFLDCRSTQIRL
jgi:hypothetical protein